MTMNKKSLLIFILCPLLFCACKKDLTSLNTDPKSPTAVPASSLFLQGEKSLVDVYTTTRVDVAPFRVLAQSWTENAYVFEAQYVLSNYESPDGYWNYIYAGPDYSPTSNPPVPAGTGVLNNLEAAKQTFPLYVADPVALRNDLIISDILEIYGYYFLVNTYGNIPYSQALSRTIAFPKYDDAKTIYTDLLTRIDTCIAGLNTSGGAMGAADQIYGGDVGQWLKFAATLKLKMALIMADVDLPTATTKVQEAVATGVFQSNSDNAMFAYDPASPGNSNPMWQALVLSGRHDFVPCDLLVNTMDSLNDPRDSLYFQRDGGGNYTGGVPGAPNGYHTVSDFSAPMQAPDFPGDILDYSQTEFLLAEAAARGIAVGGTAETHYDNAITASIEAWGGSSTDAATYLAQPSVAYTTAWGGNWRQEIGYQSWIALYNGNWDAWTVIRRLGYPNIDVINPPQGAVGNLPLRFNYPNNEVISNSINWKAAVAALPGGQDVVSAKLWWMP
jgi:hypothetical protein